MNNSKLYKREQRVALLFVLLPIIGFILFSAIPIVYSAYTSLTNWNGLSKMEFIGLTNYIAVFKDPYFYKAMWNTFFLMLGIPVGLGLSFTLASFLSKELRGTSFFRTAYYIPVVSSLAAISILWQWAYNGDFGLVNQVLAIIGIDGPNWLQDASTVKPAIIIMTVWKGLGYSMLLYLAAIKSIPKSFYEASELDGASTFQRFRFITWPMVKPVTFFLVVTNIIGGSQIFTEINIMTPDGGPEFSSASIVWYIWRKAFSNFQMGYASAMAIILGIIIFTITALQFYINNKSEYKIE